MKPSPHQHCFWFVYLWLFLGFFGRTSIFSAFPKKKQLSFQNEMWKWWWSDMMGLHTGIPANDLYIISNIFICFDMNPPTSLVYDTKQSNMKSNYLIKKPQHLRKLHRVSHISTFLVVKNAVFSVAGKAKVVWTRPEKEGHSIYRSWIFDIWTELTIH